MVRSRAVWRVGADFVELLAETPLAAGDGIVFDTGGDPDAEQGGRIFALRGRRLYFQYGHLDFPESAPATASGRSTIPRLANVCASPSPAASKRAGPNGVDLRASGEAGELLTLEAAGKTVRSAIPLQAARTTPLTTSARSSRPFRRQPIFAGRTA